EEIEAVHRHPTRGVGLLEKSPSGQPGVAAGLLETSPSGQPGVAVKRTDIVQSEESAFEYIVALRILAVYPPREIEQQLLEYPLQKSPVPAAVHLFFDLVDADRLPRLQGRVGVAELPFVRRYLSVRMHVPLAREQQQLI